MKTYRFVTTKGSVTIPFDIRIREGWNTGTLVSIEKQKDGALLLRKESICDCGKNNRTHETSLFHGDVEARDLDDVYHIFNGYHEPYIGTFQGHSLSVSDVVEVLGDIPEMYGRVDYLGSSGEVGEEYWIATKEAYDREVYDSIDCGRPFTPHILEGQHITLVEPGCHFCDSFGWVKCENFDTSECEDMDGLRALMILPGKTPVETRIINELSHWQRAVSNEIKRYVSAVGHLNSNPKKIELYKAILAGLLSNSEKMFGSAKQKAGYDDTDSGRSQMIELNPEDITLIEALIADIRHIERMRKEEPRHLKNRAGLLIKKLSSFKNQSGNNIWVETDENRLHSICSASKNIGRVLREYVWETSSSFVLTSGTMSDGVDFSFFEKENGIHQIAKVFRQTSIRY